MAISTSSGSILTQRLRRLQLLLVLLLLLLGCSDSVLFRPANAFHTFRGGRLWQPPHCAGRQPAASFRLEAFGRANNCSRFTQLNASKSQITMPALSSTMTEGRIVKWIKQVGDAIQVGDSIMVVESDKADMEVESFDSGFLAAQLLPENAMCAVGQPVGIIVANKEDIQQINSASGANNVQEDATQKLDQNQSTLTLSMPKLSNTPSHIVRWTAKVGDTVKMGQVLFIVENDKCDFEVEAPQEGVLTKILVKEGVRVDTGYAVGELTVSCTDNNNIGHIVEANQESVAENASMLPQGTSQVLMPALSSTMTSGRITKWLKNEGDHIKVGDRIVVVESDKADMEVEAFEEGILAKQVVSESEEAPVGGVIAYICKSGNDCSLLKSALLSRTSNPSGPQHGEPVNKLVSTTEAAASIDPENSNLESSSEQAGVWTQPTLDQFVIPQLPAGVSHKDLHATFENRIKKHYPQAHQQLLQDPKNRSAQLDRVGVRVPPPHILFNQFPRYLQKNQASTSSPEPINKGQAMGTPAAESLAKKNNLSLNDVKGSGFNGRVTVHDIHQHLNIPSQEGHITNVNDYAQTKSQSKTPKPHSSESIQLKPTNVPVKGSIEMTSMQKAIAKNMEATMNVPIFRVTRGIFIGQFENLLKQLRTAVDDKITMSTLLAKAVASVLARHPLINSSFDASGGGKISHPGSVDIGIAVSTPNGLVTPVLRDVHKKSLAVTTSEFQDLVKKARDGKLTGNDCSNASFYISNLGMFGVDQFDAILPQKVGCILAVSAAKEVQTVNGIDKKMTVTITCDHRHIYGAHAADFLRDLANLMEQYPASILL